MEKHVNKFEVKLTFKSGADKTFTLESTFAEKLTLDELQDEMLQLSRAFIGSAYGGKIEKFWAVATSDPVSVFTVVTAEVAFCTIRVLS